jgi:acetyltransferase-like isoleucine patch superfamily enzyme
MPYNPYDPKEVVSIQPYSGKSPSIIGPVELEENTWLGLNVLVGPGIRIGRNSFVRTNAVVMQSFDENSYIGGDPAILIKNRYNYK